ncbi:MAG: DNA mismatch repair endonuclease MutL [Clostridia bacterium]|nr:DNA mismatch repair endonuclease MutL [Clostridia bacterium]
MGNIVLLDELTINQIAAGEVVERPASVVKEMIENSIDAGAKNITVEIKNGGISYIRITDDGKGIAKDDVEMAFERHATSKIRSAEDLQDVKSMGFRGEALASIAAISNVELITKTEEELTGTKVIVEGGDVLDIEETGCSKGTTITVRNLFYNTPVRYKFLKKDFTETGYIEDVITRIALVHPEIAIKLINTGKTVIQTIGNGDLKTVVYSIYGKDISEEVLPVDYEYDYIKISGVIGKPVVARSNRSNQIFFVNKRYIKDKTLTSAAEQAYKGLLPIGKFGFMVLNLEMSPNKVDVNVHPAKLEVRFEEESIAFKSVYHAIKDTLLKADLISDREINKEIKEAAKEAFKIEPEVKTDGGLFGKKQVTDANISSDTVKVEVANVNNTEIPEKTIELNKVENESIAQKDDDMDVFTRLEKLQANLKAEIESNPKIEYTDDYKAMEERYNEIAVAADNISKELESQMEKEEKPQQENQEDEKTETEMNEKQEENTQAKEDAEATKVIEVVEDEQKSNLNEVKKQIVSFEEMYKQLFGKEPYKTTKANKSEEKYEDKIEDVTSNMSVFEDIAEYKPKTYKFIGIAFKTYIILEMNKELYIMDQHAAHERIMYEKVKKNFYSEKEKCSQMLLLPDIITLTHKEMEIAKENFDLFENAGFMLEEFGENTIKLSGVPEVCIDLDTKELFMETLDEINTVARTAKQEKEEKFIATVACKAAVKANMVLEEAEVDSLMDQLLQLPNPFTCPHGRPTVIKMSKTEIEKKFERT